MHVYLDVPYPPVNSPLPSLILKFLHRYVCLDYKPPSHQVDCTRTCMRERVCTYVTSPFNWLQRGIYCVWWWLLEKPVLKTFCYDGTSSLAKTPMSR